MTNTLNEKQRYSIAFKMIIKRYLAVALKNKRNTLLGLILPAIGSIFVFYLPPIAIAEVVSKAVNEQSRSVVDYLPLVALFGLSWLVGEIFWRFGLFFMFKAEAKAFKTLHEEGLSELLNRDLSFFHDNFAGSLTKKTLAYANRYIDIAETMMFNVFSRVVPVIFALVVLAIYSPWLALWLFFWLSATIAAIIPFIKRRKAMVTEREIAGNVVSGHIADIYGNIDAVRAHASEDIERRFSRKFVSAYARKMKRSWDYQNQVIDVIISPLYVFINASGLLLSIYLASRGDFAFTSIIVVFAYYTLATSFVWEFNGIYRRIEAALSDAAQFTELLLTEPTIADPEKPQKNQAREGRITFDNVNFAYKNNGGNNLFNGFNLGIQGGEKVGLIGRSGGGKSSIIKLLLRFNDVSSGSILIDDVPIDRMSQKELRSLIAYVPQDPVMFHRSIAENIAYGRPDATPAEITKAAKQAHAHEFIEKLPKGYETLVGERGIKLSGGQRQRIAIARAILRNTPILLLDEATSALDSESEVLIQDALKKLMKNRTAIVIAHRLSTIQNMDRIIVMEHGAIVEEGSHRELLAGNGIYAKLWNHQSGGFLED